MMKHWIILLLTIPFLGFSQNKVAFVQVAALNTDINNPNRTVVSAAFEVREGLILVEGAMNGEEGYYILDTGAPMMVVNSTLENAESIAAAGVTTDFTAQLMEIESFQWANIEYKNLEAVAIDISHLERAAGKRVLGLIGYEILKQYEVFFDYANHLVRLFPARNNELHNNFTPTSSVKFSIEDHLPILEMQIGKQSYRVGLDTGSEVNLLANSERSRLNPMQINGLRKEEIQGVDKVVHPVFATLITSTQVAEHDFRHMKYLFTDLSHLKDLKIDGLLGFPFFSQYKCSINYRKGRVYFWE